MTPAALRGARRDHGDLHLDGRAAGGRGDRRGPDPDPLRRGHPDAGAHHASAWAAWPPGGRPSGPPTGRRPSGASARRPGSTFLGAALAQFTWWICTAGSDQMAIQRYLATRDAKTARRVLLTSLSANVFVYGPPSAGRAGAAGLLPRPSRRLAPGTSVLTDADKLFPRFIVVGMPARASAAWSWPGCWPRRCRASPRASTPPAPIITVDFIDRFRRRRDAGPKPTTSRRPSSSPSSSGSVVVALSTGVGMVQGNLLEIAFKVVNLLTAPLFGLFFMAMFVRWATQAGTIIGAVFGLAGRRRRQLLAGDHRHPGHQLPLGHAAGIRRADRRRLAGQPAPLRAAGPRLAASRRRARLPAD